MDSLQGLGVRDVVQPIETTSLGGRLSYAVICLVCLVFVSGCFALRTHHLTLRSLTTMPLIRFYLLAVYFWGICFIISVAALRFGIGVRSPRTCLASIILCLVFYVVDKVIMYLFLIERVHVVRCRQFSRRADYWYLTNMAIVALGFGSIAVLSFIFPVAELSEGDGRCRIGLPFKITLPLLIYDISINLYLTSHFMYFARLNIVMEITGRIKSLFGGHKGPWEDVCASNNEDRCMSSKARRRKHTKLRNLARRTLNGMCVMLLATTINLAILFHMSGHEEEWMCFMICTIDVTVGILALHYVTNDPTEKQLGEKQSQPGTRMQTISSVYAPVGNPTSPQIVPETTSHTMIWAGDRDDDKELITVPNRIFVKKSYEFCHQDASSPETRRPSSTPTIEKKLVAHESQDV